MTKEELRDSALKGGGSSEWPRELEEREGARSPPVVLEAVVSVWI